MSPLAIAAAFLLAADIYYVSPDGRPENNGSLEKPWPSVEHALSKVGGGHTIVFRPGVYRGPIQVPKSCAGTKERPTVFRSEIKWKAVVIGAPVHAIYTGDACGWVVIDGLEVTGARMDGIKVSGDHSAVRNCWVHNNGHMGIAAHNKKGTVIENNLVEFNGQHVQLHHGVYADGEGLTVRANVVRHNSAYGLHLYPKVKDSTVALNVVYGHARKAGIIVTCPEGGGRNVIVNNTVVDNQGGIDLWQGDGEMVSNNIVLARGEPLAFTNGSRNVKAEANLTAGNPMFVDASHGVYWLKAGSPAIGKGIAEVAPAADFWGRPRAKDRPVDLGAFTFEEGMTAAWSPSSWPYRFSSVPDERGGTPDFWVPPGGKK